MTKGGVYYIDGKGINVASTASQTATGLNEKLTTAMALGKQVVIYNIKYGSSTPATPAPVTVRPGTSGVMRAQLDNYLIQVSASGDVVTCSNLIPAASSGS